MARFNMYLPDDLKKRMDRASGVVWSQICADAIELKLGELAAARKEKKMEDVIQRLRAAETQERTTRSTEGEADGYRWARDYATPAELRRLGKLGSDFFDGIPGRFNWADMIYMRTDGISPDPLGRLESNAAELFGDDYETVKNDVDYLRGWVAGAVKLWSEVKSKL